MENSLYELIAPCHFGLESVLKREIQGLGYNITGVEDGRVTFQGDAAAICRSNVFLRTAERVLIKAGSFRAENFDELFDNTAAIDWASFIPKDGRFWVTKASSVNSKVHSPSDIQSIMKKAMVESLKKKYGYERFPETGDDYPVRVFIKKDEVSVGIDTTGQSLHKRGYRLAQSKAPIAENLAAALIMLTPWRGDRILLDPFCGSGTFPIEAAMMACNIAPGMDRSFTAENWQNIIPKKAWYQAVDEAGDMIKTDVETSIQGYDIDEKVIRLARENAQRAGVEKYIHFQARDVGMLSHPKKYGFIITNPPYGERLSEKNELRGLYRTLGDRFRALQDWSLYVITGYEDAPSDIGLKSAKNRKIYNGMIKTYFYQFPGAKPPGNKGRMQEKADDRT
ncbi:MAG: class I SAM-dependent RNA methyltransferase [Lachnospiraceae bacterium]|nr:class I SAM-dependent RNA methyltransferase [Lachnospiraceae bacterium]